MPNDVNVHVKTTGTRQSKQKLDQFGRAAADVGKKTNKAGRDGAEGLGQLGDSASTSHGRFSKFASMLSGWVTKLAGVALLIASRVVIDLVFLKRSNLNSEISLDDNLAAGALAMGGYLATAILLAACLHR